MNLHELLKTDKEVIVAVYNMLTMISEPCENV